MLGNHRSGALLPERRGDTLSRYARRTDNNHAEIRDALRSIPGVKVADISRAGNGIPDLIAKCDMTGITALFEIKVKGGKQTEKEVGFGDYWGAGYHVIYSLDDALSILGLLTGE